MARHAQIIQNNKFPISVPYLYKEVSEEADFLRADKHESLATYWYYDFDGDGQVFPKFPK